MRNSEIHDVVVTPLKLLPNEAGRLMEVQRVDDDHYPGFGQAYITQSLNGVVKAWYRHERQIDQIAVVSGLSKLVLYDDREDSPTNGVVQVIMMGELQPRLVKIPPMIWHGFKAIGETSAFFLHLNTHAFDFDNPDEERLPADDPKIPYEW
ncbi:MAG: dTDP-4-dehydrorhamnose 3,5-epimerase family protein [Pseudomonadota bacterium]